MELLKTLVLFVGLLLYISSFILFPVVMGILHLVVLFGYSFILWFSNQVREERAYMAILKVINNLDEGKGNKVHVSMKRGNKFGLTRVK